MVNQIKCEIEQEMCQILNNEQMNLLQKESEKLELSSITTNKELLQVFLTAKRVEGCSEKSIAYYKTTLEAMLQKINRPIKQIITED